MSVTAGPEIFSFLRCRQVRKLKISGPAVTDTGLGLLCTEGSQSGLCLSLASLSVLATTSLTLEAVLQALHHLQHLTHLSLQENLVLQILRREEREREGRIVPVRQLEVTVGPGRRDYLTPASTIAPLLTSITLWCFESENVSSLSGTQFSSAEITLTTTTQALVGVILCLKMMSSNPS